MPSGGSAGLMPGRDRNYQAHVRILQLLRSRVSVNFFADQMIQ